MLAEFMIPLLTLSCSVIMCIGCLNQLCQLHQIYQTVSARLEGEQWLLAQCSDPLFFSKMHVHSDLCFQVDNNARVGTVMLALREFTHALLGSEQFARLGGGWVIRALFSWQVAILLGLMLLFGPSWSVSRYRALQRRWPETGDEHFKQV